VKLLSCSAVVLINCDSVIPPANTRHRLRPGLHQSFQSYACEGFVTSSRKPHSDHPIHRSSCSRCASHLHHVPLGEHHLTGTSGVTGTSGGGVGWNRSPSRGRNLHRRIRQAKLPMGEFWRESNRSECTCHAEDPYPSRQASLATTTLEIGVWTGHKPNMEDVRRFTRACDIAERSEQSKGASPHGRLLTDL
jgi:hypothetical protein